MSCETQTLSVPRHAESRCDVVTSHPNDTSLAVGEHRGIAVRRAALPACARTTVISALRPGQAWPVLAVHEGLSPASRRLRYSAPTPRLSPRMVGVLTDLRPGRHEAYAAWRGGRPSGRLKSWTPNRPRGSDGRSEPSRRSRHGVPACGRCSSRSTRTTSEYTAG